MGNFAVCTVSILDTMPDAKNQPLKRSEEITRDYLLFLDKHLLDVVEGRVMEMKQLREIADALFVSHKHLTDTVQQTLGNHPCHFYDLKIIEQAKKMLATTDMPIAEIARSLTYDPSNFSKFFKKWVGETPGNFRERNKR